MRRRIMASVGGKALPYDAEVEYLESSGTQWIETGKYGSRVHVISAKCEWLVFTTIFGCRDGVYKNAVYCGCYGGNDGRYTPNYDNVDAGEFKDVVDGIPHVVSFGPDNVSLDGEKRYRNFTDFTTSYTIPLFGNRNGTNTVNPRTARIYWFEIEDVMMLIPIRFTNENGVSEGAMYDRVSGQLFRNAGTGAFIVGPDKASVASASSGGGTGLNA